MTVNIKIAKKPFNEWSIHTHTINKEKFKDSSSFSLSRDDFFS